MIICNELFCKYCNGSECHCKKEFNFDGNVINEDNQIKHFCNNFESVNSKKSVLEENIMSELTLCYNKEDALIEEIDFLKNEIENKKMEIESKTENKKIKNENKKLKEKIEKLEIENQEIAFQKISIEIKLQEKLKENEKLKLKSQKKEKEKILIGMIKNHSITTIGTKEDDFFEINFVLKDQEKTDHYISIKGNLAKKSIKEIREIEKRQEIIELRSSLIMDYFFHADKIIFLSSIEQEKLKNQDDRIINIVNENSQYENHFLQYLSNKIN